MQTTEQPATNDFKTAFDGAGQLVQNSILDFLYVVDCRHMQKTSANFEPRSNGLDFEGEILPILQKLCPSFHLNGYIYDSEHKIQYNLSWEAGTLHVPEFVIQESDRQFKEWIEMFGISEENDEDADQADENGIVENATTSTSSTRKTDQFDPYDMLPLDLF
jgi:hypothetical protein